MAPLRLPHRAHRLPCLLLLLLTLLPPSFSLSASDLAALRSIKDTLTDLPGSHFFSTWDFSAAAGDPCSSFLGLTCSGDRVTGLSLGPTLAGSLPPSLSSLSALTQLLLSPGIVTGPIPSGLGLLSSLRVLSLPHNRLTGPIPISLSSLRYLHTLDLSFNQLSGTIPPPLAALPNLKVLILSSNRLSGDLPAFTAPLLHLDARQNYLTGPLPRLPTSLRYLSFSQNALWGPLTALAGPSSIPELTFLDLSMNLLAGPIPPSLFTRPSVLSSMLLQRNNLSGVFPAPMPPRGESYGPGSVVDLSHNAIAGDLPPILAGVETLFLNNNRLTGPVPVDYVRSVCEGTTRTLYLQHNYLTNFPMERGMSLPDTVALCLSYNCMMPPVGLSGCPSSAGTQLSRPSTQCSIFIGPRG